MDIRDKRDGNKKEEDPRIYCKYGSKCFQKNPDHFKKFRHPPIKKNNENDADATKKRKPIEFKGSPSIEEPKAKKPHVTPISAKTVETKVEGNKTEAPKPQRIKIEFSKTPVVVLEKQKIDVFKTDVSKTQVVKTDVSKTEVSKTQVVKTEKPKTEVSKTEVSESEVSETDDSNTAVSKTEIPKTEISKTDPSKTESSETETSKSEITKTESEKTETSKSEVTKTEISKTDVSKTEVSKTDISKPDISKADVPKADVSKSDVSKPEDSKTDVSKTDVSKTDVSKTDVSKTEVSKTEVSKSEVKKIEKQKIETSINEAPKTAAIKTEIAKTQVPKSVEKNQDLYIEARKLIAKLFLVTMPNDFYKFYDFCNQLKPSDPSTAFKIAELKLVGPYDVLSGLITKNTPYHEKFLAHWRYYYDPPEFQTIIKGNDREELHFGYWRDRPSADPIFVAENSSGVSHKIKPIGENIFGAVANYLEERVKKVNPFEKTGISNILGKLKIYAKNNNFSLEPQTPKMKSREKTVVARTIHGAGIVCPYNKKTQVGYRELSVTDNQLLKIVKKIDDANSESEVADARSELSEVVRLATIAGDECDFGTCLELGHDLLSTGCAQVQNAALVVLSIAYNQLDRQLFLKIVEAHLKNRKRGSNTSALLSVSKDSTTA